MSEYRLEINGTIGLSDYSNINDYLNIIGENDKVIITVGPGESHNADIISNILRHNGFEVFMKGGHDDSRFHITAIRQGDEFKG
jgi:methanogenic corrinoid protein MtbC1